MAGKMGWAVREKTGGASGLFFPAVLDSRIPCCVSGVFCV